MIQNEFLTKIRFREDTALNWSIANPILESSEPGREIDTGFIKYGDGVTHWNELPYQETAQSDLADNNSVNLSYVKNKSTKYLINDGDGISPYVTNKDLNDRGYATVNQLIQIKNELQPKIIYIDNIDSINIDDYDVGQIIITPVEE